MYFSEFVTIILRNVTVIEINFKQVFAISNEAPSINTA